MSNYTNVPQHNFLNKQYSRLSPNSTEWARIEYLLQLSSGYTSATVKNIWTITNPHMTQTFEKASKGLLTLDSWLEISLLDENNRMEKVCTKGFEFPQTGLRFPTGHIKLQDNIQPGRVYELLLLKIAVGKSYCLPDKTSMKDKYKLIQGFDSIYLYNEDEDSMTGTFKHDYVLFDNGRVLPCYVVQFEFDQKKEDNLNSPFCDICNDNTATIYCKADDMNLCYDCDEEHHLKGGKLVSKHQRIPINEKPKTFGNCQQHPDQKLELFCTIDRTPLCLYCKIGGSHSSGESANHPLVKISDAYMKSLVESKDIDPLIEKRKNQLAEYLQQIDYSIKEVNKNASIIEGRIYQVLQEALLQLQEETQKKMSYLVGDQLELKRQYDQIQWLESFLKYQQEVLTPADYLNAWSRHIGLRNEILNISNVPQLTIVEPDLRLEGKLSVVSDSVQFKDTKEQQDEQDYIDQNSLIGTTRFRSNIFGKHQVSDKNQRLMKTIIQQNVQKESQGPQLLLLQQKQKLQQQAQASRVFQQLQNDTIQESQINDSQNSSFAQ
ncbi:unnamed protein product (macronuclear) [Paramecium tetraurelia]|uniref:B box-type domain-containing protein n=1 Tax=Paramecium tetraurelia TaxID=5888 RepID=A0CQ77_PARTE|nr:uncharacterized protein GSPATT00009292001 [Paramecium tetraurelia]CAK72944.1 unnamed protein product [Paramecium tetraurelia]|eukprot:XP_001440341.1 hypothetical protein (macronuclear) [Paramecium tetraurelia strain d4-2]